MMASQPYRHRNSLPHPSNAHSGHRASVIGTSRVPAAMLDDEQLVLALPFAHAGLLVFDLNGIFCVLYRTSVNDTRSTTRPTFHNSPSTTSFAVGNSLDDPGSTGPVLPASGTLPHPFFFLVPNRPMLKPIGPD